MKVSVVVPAFNEAGGLRASLDSTRAAMEAFARRGWAAELIVCDNNSTDGTAAIARDAGATVVFEPVNQIARARNTGAAAATGDWLLFVDADSHPTVALCDDAAEAMSRADCLAGGATIRFETTVVAARVLARLWNAVSRLSGVAAGSFIFCEATAFRALGGFSVALYAAEEIELFDRLTRLARRTRRRVVILHRHPLRTSDRKWHLYSHGELWRFLFRTVARGGRTLRNPEDCFAWYDGRR